ncbi:unnamed protein product [Gordionus sp. m RMFG-2023]
MENLVIIIQTYDGRNDYYSNENFNSNNTQTYDNQNNYYKSGYFNNNNRQTVTTKTIIIEIIIVTATYDCRNNYHNRFKLKYTHNNNYNTNRNQNNKNHTLDGSKINTINFEELENDKSDDVNKDYDLLNISVKSKNLDDKKNSAYELILKLYGIATTI